MPAGRITHDRGAPGGGALRQSRHQLRYRPGLPDAARGADATCVEAG
jgi:hypothetical protein